MIYITYEDLCRDIRQNLTRIPKDVCGVVGVPRSGMLPATIIAEYLNVPMFDLHSLVEIGHGGRPLKRTAGNKLLVVDDTCFHGNSLTVTKRTLREHGYDGFDFEFLVVYLEGPCDRDKPDIYLRDIREQAKDGPFGWALYEWNIFAHGRLTERTLFDLDGVICAEPPDERDVEAYEAYIKSPTPLHVPTAGTVNICTYRLEKYRVETAEGLAKIGVLRTMLIMATGRHERAWELKSRVYKINQWLLFVESSAWQAERIHKETGKPVICIENNKLYY